MFECKKTIKCEECPHFRYDDTLGTVACWAEYDMKRNYSQNRASQEHIFGREEKKC